MNGVTASPVAVDRPFSGALGQDYDFIKLICPNVPILHARIAGLLAESRHSHPSRKFTVVELGCGTGLLTEAILLASQDIVVHAIDIEPVMLRQARANLASAVATDRLHIVERDAVSFLVGLPPSSVDAVASAYCLHNFTQAYRERTFREIVRVLRPGGLFANGDRFALDDASAHLRAVQREVSHFFSTFGALQRLDLLEQWIVHLIGDESADCIMRAGVAQEVMARSGLVDLQWQFRKGVDGLLTARRPT